MRMTMSIFFILIIVNIILAHSKNCSTIIEKKKTTSSLDFFCRYTPDQKNRRNLNI